MVRRNNAVVRSALVLMSTNSFHSSIPTFNMGVSFQHQDLLWLAVLPQKLPLLMKNYQKERVKSSTFHSLKNPVKMARSRFYLSMIPFEKTKLPDAT